MDNDADKSVRHGFSIAAVLLLTAVVAIALASVQTMVMELDKLEQTGQTQYYNRGYQTRSPYQESLDELGMRSFGGAIIGLFVGVVVGVGRPRPFFGVLFGIPFGAITGGVSGGVLIAPCNLPLVAIGSAVLILLGLMVRKFSHRPE
jgi:hypothetical protein